MPTGRSRRADRGSQAERQVTRHFEARPGRTPVARCISYSRETEKNRVTSKPRESLVRKCPRSLSNLARDRSRTGHTARRSRTRSWACFGILGDQIRFRAGHPILLNKLSLSIVIAGLTLFAATAARANQPDWRVAASGESAAYEVDSANIRIREGLLTAWVRVTHSTEQSAGRYVYLSEIALYVFNCDSESSGMANVATYAGPRGTGKLVFAGDYARITAVEMQYLPPDSIGYGVMEFVCSNSPRKSPP
jgi:hypothetical protein